jgi:hypothetical protein
MAGLECPDKFYLACAFRDQCVPCPTPLHHAKVPQTRTALFPLAPRMPRLTRWVCPSSVPAGLPRGPRSSRGTPACSYTPCTSRPRGDRAQARVRGPCSSPPRSSSGTPGTSSKTCECSGFCMPDAIYFSSQDQALLTPRPPMNCSLASAETVHLASRAPC